MGAAAAMLSAGCAYAPMPAMSVWSGGEVPVPVWYVTDRAPDAALGFGPRWGAALSCGRVSVTVAGAGTPVRQSATGPVQDCDGDAAMAAFAGQAAAAARAATGWDGQPCRRLLLAVHGFNNTFADAVTRAGQVAHDVAWPCPVLAFTWSSEGRMDRYAADAERSGYSVPYLIALLQALKAQGLTTDLIAHSMGNRLALSALSALCARQEQPSPLAGQVILAAPDVNAERLNDDFQIFLRKSAPCARRITVYASENDLALIASETLHGGIPRAGRRPRTNLQYPGEAALAGKVEVIDATDAPGGDTGHGYYADSYEMARDVMWVLDGATLARRAEAAAPYDGGLTCRDGHGDACSGGRYVLTVAKDRRPSWRFRLIRQLWPRF